MRILTALLALFASPALAQTYPSPIFAQLTVNGALSAGGNLSVGGAATITGALSAAGSASLGSLAVSGYSTLKGVTMLSPVISDCRGYAFGNAATQISCSLTVPLADLAPIAPDTFIGNTTVSRASPAAVTLPSCSQAGQVLNYVSGSGFTCVAALTAPNVGGRLTLVSNGPIMTGSVASAATLYYTPYSSNYVVLWDGSKLALVSFTELAMSATDTLKNPGALSANACYDAFVWNDAGTLRLSHGPAWSNCTSRGYSFTQNGAFFFNQNAITNGPGAGLGLWVGSFMTNGSARMDWIPGGGGAGGSPATFGVWNKYNQVPINTQVFDSNSWWIYNTVAWRPSDNSTNNRVTFMVGADWFVEAHVECFAYGYNQTTAGAWSTSGLSICIDCTNNANASGGYFGGTGGGVTLISSTFNGPVAVGKHYFQATETAFEAPPIHQFGNLVLIFRAQM